MYSLIYNGKLYYGLLRGDIVELRSLTKDDDGFKLDNDFRYIKCINKNECLYMRKVWLFTECSGEHLMVEGIDYRMNDLFTVSIGGWTDNYKWYNIEALPKYYLVFEEYFNPKEENKMYLTKDNVIDYARLFCKKMVKDIVVC